MFLGDEVCCGATAAKCWAEGYAPLTRKIRQYLGPDAIIYANECLDITNPSLNVTEVPPDFDLISVDHCALTTPPPSAPLPRALTAAAVAAVLWHTCCAFADEGYLPGTSGQKEVEVARANYEVLFSKMHPHQRAVLLPGTFACSNLSWAKEAHFPLCECQDIISLCLVRESSADLSDNYPCAQTSSRATW